MYVAVYAKTANTAAIIDAAVYPRMRLRSIAAEMKHAKGIARMDIQRQGNCTRRSLGSTSQNLWLIRAIRNAAVTESATNALQRLCVSGTALGRPRGKLNAENIPVNSIIRTAALDAMRLKALCSASAITLYKKFCDGCKPDASAREIFTQLCSYAAGTR